MRFTFFAQLAISWLAIFATKILAVPCSQSESRLLVHQFYTLIQHENLGAFPDRMGFEKLKPFLSSDLGEGLNAAVVAGEKSALITELPPYENSFLSSYAEGYTNFYVSGFHQNKKSSMVEIILQHRSLSESPAVMEEKDYVEVINENGVCKINDLLFAADAYAENSLRGRVEKINSYGAE